jgi:hypothetical protein
VIDIEWRGVITSERDGQGMFLIQPAPNGQLDGGGASSYKALFPSNLFSCPIDAERDADLQPIYSCDALVGEDGEERFVVSMVDGRIVSVLPPPGKGGGGIYGAIPGTPWRSSHGYFVGTGIEGKTVGSFILQVPGNTSGAHELLIDRADDTITIRHKSGHTITMTTTNIVIQFDNGGKITANATGVKVEGVRVELGGSGGFPVVYDNGALTTWIANITGALNTLGVPVAPPGPFSSATTSTSA